NPGTHVPSPGRDRALHDASGAGAGQASPACDRVLSQALPRSPLSRHHPVRQQQGGDRAAGSSGADPGQRESLLLGPRGSPDPGDRSRFPRRPVVAPLFRAVPRNGLAGGAGEGWRRAGTAARAEARRALSLDGRALLFFGYVRPYKGLEDLLTALRLARPDAWDHLVIVGEFYEPEARYRPLLEDPALRGRVRVVNRYV